MKRRFLVFAFIFICALPILLFRDYTPSNELRYLNIADDAIANGHLFAFYDHGVPYADKPPLYFWIMMFFKILFGEHLMFFLSLLSIVPAFVTAWIMDKWTENKFSPEERSAGNLMLFTSVFFLASSIVLRMDMLMAMFITLSLYTFYKMYTNSAGARDVREKARTHQASLYKRARFMLPVFVFLAIFSKGAVGFLVPIVSILVFLAFEKKLRFVGRFLGWRFWSILIILCALWFTGVYIDGGNTYLDNLIFNQTVNRAVNSFHHKNPFWYYLVAYWYIFAPWCIFIAVAIIRGYRKRLAGGTMEKFFACTAFSTFLMLSAISSKIAIYMLPAVPFFVYLALILLPKMKESKWIHASFVIPAVLLIVAFIASVAAPAFIRAKMPDFQLPKLWAPYPVITMVLLAGGAIAIMLARRKKLSGAISAISCSVLLLLFAGSLSIKRLNKYIGVRDGCAEALELANKNNETLCFYDFSSGPNLDYFFKGKGIALKEVKKDEIADIEGVVLFIKERDIKKDSVLRDKILGIPRSKWGSDISVVEIKRGNKQ